MLVALWLPIVLSAVAVFFLSFPMWMVLPHHRTDFRRLPDEDALAKELEKQVAQPGLYGFPHCANPSQMKDPDWIERSTNRLAGQLTIRPRGEMKMGKSMGQSLLFNLVVSALVGYVGWEALGATDDGLRVAHVTTVVAWLAYGGALGWRPIWFFEPWSVTAKGIFDALVYGLATGLLFMAFWPGAA